MSHDTRINELIDRWDEARRGDRELTPEELCAECPELLDEVRQGIAKIRQVEALLPQSTVKETAPGAPVPATLPGYEVLEELGRGGMGVVYRARQTSVDRVVALKMVLAGAHAGEQDLQRFQSEAEAVARLHHPHIVQLYECGRHEGVPYFTMEFVADGSLAARLQGKPLPPREAAWLVEQIAQGVQHAHERGILHRDLKPHNVLLTENGIPKVTDFGLAKRVTVEPGALGARGLTATGAILGTPSYMAPEQARGDGKRIGPAADIYALGAILYECLTGRPPFQAADMMETLMQVVRDEPLSPSRLVPSLPRDVVTICLKCLQKEPGRRYASASVLEQDLQRFRAGEPIQARPVGTTERVVKWVKRRPAIAAMLVLLAVVTIGGLAGITLAYRRALRAEEAAVGEKVIAQEQRDSALKEKKRADDRAEETRRQLAFSRFALADAAWREGQAALTQEHLAAVPPDLRQWEWRYLKRLSEGSIYTLRGHGGGVKCVAFSPDGQLLAAGGYDQPVKVWDARNGRELSSVHCETEESHETEGFQESIALSRDGQRLMTGRGDTAKVWDLHSGRVLLTLGGHDGEVTAVAFSSDGQRLATASGAPGKPAEARVWDVRTGRQMFSLKGLISPVMGIAFGHADQQLAHSSGDRTVRVWDLGAEREVFILKCDLSSRACLAYSPDGQRLVAGDGALGGAKVWDMRTGQQLLTLEGAASRTMSVGFSPDGQRLATGNFDGTTKLWDVRTGRLLHPLTGHTSAVTSLGFSPDGQHLATGSGLTRDSEVKVWDLVGGKDVLSLGDSDLRCMAFSPDVQRVATVNFDGRTKVWDARSGHELLPLQEHTGSIRRAAFSPDGQRLATGGGVWDVKLGHSASGEAKLWDARSGRELLTLKGHKKIVSSLAFSPDGRLLATGSDDGTANVWKASRGELLHSLEANPVDEFGYTSGVAAMAFSPDGQWLATTTHDGVRVWDVRSGQPLRLLKSDLIGPAAVAFSPNGQQLAAGGARRSWLGKVVIWDVPTGKELLTLEGHSSAVRSVAFSPDSHRLTTGSDDRTAKVWDARSGRLLLSLGGHVDRVTTVAYTPDGQRLVTGCRNSVKVWDARSGPEVLSLSGHTREVGYVSFSPDGRYLVSKDLDGMAKVWDVRNGREVLTLTGDPDLGPTVEFSPDGRYLLGSDIGNADTAGLVRLWDLQRAKELFALKGQMGEGGGVAFSHDSLRLAVAPMNEHGAGDVSVWDLRSGKELYALRGHRGGVARMTFSPDRLRLAAVRTGRKRKPLAVRVWDLAGGKEQFTLRGPTGEAWSLAFSPDGLRLACGSGGVGEEDEPGVIMVWDARSGKELHTLKGHTVSVTSLAFSPEGLRLASRGSAIGEEDKPDEGKIWDLQSGKELHTLKGLSDSVGELSFSQDGRHLTGKVGPGRTIVWDVQTGRLLHADAAPPLDFVQRSPDGRLVAHIDGRVVRLFRPPTAEELNVRQQRTAFDANWQFAEAKRQEAAGQWFAAAFHVGQLLQNVRPDPSWAEWLLQLHAKAGRWSDVLFDLDRLASLAPSHPNLNVLRAHALLALDQRDGYRKVCEVLVRQHDQTRRVVGALALLASWPAMPAPTAIGVCLLQPDPTATTQRLTALRACVAGSDAVADPGRLLNLATGAAGWLRGVALVRAGRFDEAVPLLAANSWSGSQHFLALAEHARGRVREATIARDRALRWLDTPSTGDPKRLNRDTLTWEQRLELDLLRREVEAKLGSVPPIPTTPPPMQRVP